MGWMTTELDCIEVDVFNYEIELTKFKHEDFEVQLLELISQFEDDFYIDQLRDVWTLEET